MIILLMVYLAFGLGLDLLFQLLAKRYDVKAVLETKLRTRFVAILLWPAFIYMLAVPKD